MNAVRTFLFMRVQQSLSFVHSFENWEVAEDSISLYNIKFYIVKNIRLWRKLFIYIYRIKARCNNGYKCEKIIC